MRTSWFPSTDQPSRIFLACLLEATARKPGNVHPGKRFENAHFLDFVISAMIIDQHLGSESIRDQGVGKTILRTVEATDRQIGHNVNLGMILLLTPLVASTNQPGVSFETFLGQTLKQLTVEDAADAYRAIQLAGPGGLGQVPDHDASTGEIPNITLLEAMQLAADRDAIARQYATNYADIFEFARPRLQAALERAAPLETAIVETHLALMAELPDTLIIRKCGEAVALESSARAKAVLQAGWPGRPGSSLALADLDRWLRSDGHRRNPGATADLIAATLYVALVDGTIDPCQHLRNHRWDAGDAIQPYTS